MNLKKANFRNFLETRTLPVAEIISIGGRLIDEITIVFVDESGLGAGNSTNVANICK